MNDHFRDLRIMLDETLLPPAKYQTVHTALNAIEQEMSDLHKQVEGSRDTDFYAKLKNLIKEAIKAWGYEDEVDALAELIDGAHFEYDTYVHLPGMLEDILESKSEQQHYFDYESDEDDDV